MTLRLLDGGSAAPRKPARALSGRALNVLKLLAPELLGLTPPCGDWTPPEALLQQITVGTLLTARNCGPQTADEILSWAQDRGVTIRPLFHSGKSLQAIWRDLDAKFAAGKVVKAEEIAEALDKSVRRKSTRIPLAVQKILLTILRTDCA
jgi:hypothetical protein